MHAWVAQRQRETHGANRSPLIDWINRSYRLPLGSPYCGSSISKALDSAGATAPTYRGGLARGFKDRTSISARAVAEGHARLRHGDIGMYRNGNTIFGHAVVVDSVVSRTVLITLEGNTSAGAGGSQRDGDGFHRRTRTINLMAWPLRFEAFVHVRYAHELVQSADPAPPLAYRRDPDSARRLSLEPGRLRLPRRD